jgi:hypothetical protein
VCLFAAEDGAVQSLRGSVALLVSGGCGGGERSYIYDQSLCI